MKRTYWLTLLRNFDKKKTYLLGEDELHSIVNTLQYWGLVRMYILPHVCECLVVGDKLGAKYEGTGNAIMKKQPSQSHINREELPSVIP